MWTLSLLTVWCASGVSLAQAPPPKLTHVLPPGGQAGTTFEVRVVGTDLDVGASLHFSFPGVKVEAISSVEVIPPGSKQKPPAGMKSGIGQSFKVTLPDSTPIGIHDLRIVTKGGISNPRAFVVGDLKEFVEREPNDDVNTAQVLDINATVSGVIGAPTDVDYFQFQGKKGQRVILSSLTTSIDSKLPVELKLIGPGDRLLGVNRGYQNNDALLDVQLPGDGAYLIRVCSFSYTQGGPDFFYRLTITTGPWIDAVFPPVVEPGREAKVAVFGRHLPGGVVDPAMLVDGRPLEKITATIKAPADPRAGQRLAFGGYVAPIAATLDGFDFHVKSEVGRSNRFLMTYARAAVVLETEGNDARETAQRVSAPCEIAGRIDRQNDRDWYAFDAKKGQVLAIEIFADRIGSAADFYFSLRDDKGKTLVDLDESQEVPSLQFFARSDDPPRYRFTAPADGTYFLMIGAKDAFTQFGPRQQYVARIAPEEPDFRLVAMPFNTQAPDSVAVNQSSYQAMQVFVWRLGGFTGDIHVVPESLPEGVSMPPQVISGTQKQAALVFTATPTAPIAGGPIKLVGTAVISGQKLVREVRSATITWPVAQAGTPTISRLDRELVLSVRDKAPYTLTIEKDKIAVWLGDKVKVPIKLHVHSPEFKSQVQVVALSLPAGMALSPLTLSPGKETGTLIFDAKPNVLPGNYTLVIRGQTQPVGKPPPPKGPPNQVQTAAPIALTLVPKQLAKVTLPAGPVKVALGNEVSIPLKLARLFDYAGPFKVEVILPPNLKGVTVEADTIKAGQNDGKLVVRCDSEAPAGLSPRLTVRLIAMFNDESPVVHELTVALAIGK